MSQRTRDDLRSNAYRKARAITIANATHCAICGQPLDHAADPRSRWAPSADHIVPPSQGGTHSLGNLRAVHYGCNARRGNGTTRGKGTRQRRAPQAGTSRIW